MSIAPLCSAQKRKLLAITDTDLSCYFEWSSLLVEWLLNIDRQALVVNFWLRFKITWLCIYICIYTHISVANIYYWKGFACNVSGCMGCAAESIQQAPMLCVWSIRCTKKHRWLLYAVGQRVGFRCSSIAIESSAVPISPAAPSSVLSIATLTKAKTVILSARLHNGYCLATCV